MKKIFLCIAMVCALGMMTACKYEMSVKTMGTIDTGDSSTVLLTNEYHFCCGGFSIRRSLTCELQIQSKLT